MGLSPHQGLSIVVIVCFLPFLVLAVWMCISRGVGQQWGWLYLLIIALMRVVGGSLQIASEQTHSGRLSDAASILASSGLMALILVMLEIVHKVKEKWLESNPIPPILWKVLHWSQWAAFILSIIAMADSNDRLWQAAIMLMAVMFVGQTIICIVFAIRLKHLLEDHNRTIIMLLSSIPFLTIRVLYAILNVFVTTGSVFGGSQPNVAALALMQYLMEFIVVGMYLVAGFAATSRRDKNPGEDEEEVQMTKSKQNER